MEWTFCLANSNLSRNSSVNLVSPIGRKEPWERTHPACFRARKGSRLEARIAARSSAYCRDAPLGLLLHDERLCGRRPTGPVSTKYSKPEGTLEACAPRVTRVYLRPYKFFPPEALPEAQRCKALRTDFHAAHRRSVPAGDGPRRLWLRAGRAPTAA